jgi:hypothetical protein
MIHFYTKVEIFIVINNEYIYSEYLKYHKE